MTASHATAPAVSSGADAALLTTPALQIVVQLLRAIKAASEGLPILLYAAAQVPQALQVFLLLCSCLLQLLQPLQ